MDGSPFVIIVWSLVSQSLEVSCIRDHFLIQEIQLLVLDDILEDDQAITMQGTVG